MNTMKALTVIAVTAALLTGASVASVQNAAPTTKVTPSPSNINKGSRPTVPSGAEASSAVTGRHARVSGHGKFLQTDGCERRAQLPLCKHECVREAQQSKQPALRRKPEVWDVVC